MNYFLVFASDFFLFPNIFTGLRLLIILSICRIPRLSSPRFSLSKDVIELIGVVEECYPNTTFRVKITSDEAKDHELLCHLAGRMRVNKVRILPGDRVRVEMTPYDLQKGRIVYRFRSDDPRALGIASTAPTPPPPGNSSPTNPQ